MIKFISSKCQLVFRTLVQNLASTTFIVWYDDDIRQNTVMDVDMCCLIEIGIEGCCPSCSFAKIIHSPVEMVSCAFDPGVEILITPHLSLLS